MAMDARLTRRGWLSLGAGTVGSLLAGCSSRPPAAETPEPSVFRGTSFEGTDLVVELAEDHAVDRLNLIGPDGRLFAQSPVAVGQTRVGLEIMSIVSLPGLKHYKPGLYELLAIGDAQTESKSVEMWPEVRIIDIRQYRRGKQQNDFGKLVVELENTGTGPTWIHDITYSNAPNFTANLELSDNPGIILLEYPTNPLSTVIHPGESKEYVGETSPFEFKNQDIQTCSDSYEIEVIVGTPVLDPIIWQLSASIGGEPISSGLAGQYTCSINIESIGEVR